MIELTETINPKTGLRETRDDRYPLPLVHQRRLGTLRLTGQQTAVHTVPLGGGVTLDFYAQLKRSDELIVTFPGAMVRGKHTYPFFSRVPLMQRLAPAFIAFGDPTITMDRTGQMLLGWCLGGPGFDPAHAMLRVIAAAKGKAGAKHVAFVGGSGGGLVALRMAAMVPGSMAFVNDSATNIAKSLPRTVAYYFDTIWPGWDHGQLLHALPERFDMTRHYAAAAPRNFVYYMQSTKDPRYHTDHYLPFKDACGVREPEGANQAGNRRFVLYEASRPGHGAITADEFHEHFAVALDEWRAWRD